MLAAVREFGVRLAQLHNDSTTVTVTGCYADADGRLRGGKATPTICHGHNKDFRPDLAQLLFILTVSADGAVPIAYRVADGNTPDDVTHIPTWDEPRALVGHADFLCVADSKLCSKEPMGHIAGHGGRFVTVVPHGRREDSWFRDSGPDPRACLAGGAPAPRCAPRGSRPGLAHLRSPGALDRWLPGDPGARKQQGGPGRRGRAGDQTRYRRE